MIEEWLKSINSDANRKIFTYAYGAAMCSPGIGYGKFRVGAVLVDATQRVLTVGFNQYKTHPKLAEYSDHPFLHAETHAMIRHGLENCEGKDVYVLRVRKKGDIGLSKPCDVCQMMMRDYGIRSVYYTIECSAKHSSSEYERIIFK